MMSQRNEAIDVIRGLSIIFVIAGPFARTLGDNASWLVFIFRKLTFLLGLTQWNIQVSLLE